jgi:hypothetical protein
VAGGLKGPQAIEAIVTRFERPQDPQSEIQRANAAYGSKISGSYTGGYTPTSASGGFSGSSGGYYTGPVSGTVDAHGNQIAGPDAGPYPLGAPTLPFETGPAGTPLQPDQVRQTWDMVAQQPGASPETQSIARKMRLYLSDNAS